MLRALLLTTLTLTCTLPASAQRYGRGMPRVQVPTKSMSGTIREVSGNKIVWECDGKSGPLPYDGSTQLTVTAQGDTGFVTPGAVVSVSGTLRAETKTITGASLTVHVNPAQTAGRPGRVTVNAGDPQINVKGQLVSLDPLVLKVMDGIVFVPARTEPNAVRAIPPVYDATLQVKLREAKPESVGLALGSMPKLIAAGDSVTVTVRQDRPTVASAISIRKTEVLKSGRTKEDGDKKETEKKDGNKPAAETAAGTTKPEGDGKKEAGDDAKPEMKDGAKPEMKETGKSAEGKEGAASPEAAAGAKPTAEG